MGSQQKKKKGTGDQRNTISDLKREADQDAIRTALQPTIEDISHTPQIVTQKDFVEVSESIDPSQTNAPTAPTQVTGLNVVVIGNNQLNLTWTANGSAGVIFYNIYRSLTTGTEVLIDNSSTNSFSDITVNSGTTYFYKVAAVNIYGMVGTLSAEDSATTTGTPPPPPGTAPAPSFSLALNGSAPSTQVDAIFGAVSFSPAVTSFKLYYSTSPTFSPGFVLTVPTGGAAGSTGVPGLTPNTTYYFRMSSVNSNGEGAFSTTQNITTAP